MMGGDEENQREWMVEAKIMDGRHGDCGWLRRRLWMVDAEIVDG